MRSNCSPQGASDGRLAGQAGQSHVATCCSLVQRAERRRARATCWIVTICICPSGKRSSGWPEPATGRCWYGCRANKRSNLIARSSRNDSPPNRSARIQLSRSAANLRNSGPRSPPPEQAPKATRQDGNSERERLRRLRPMERFEPLN